MVVLGRQSRLPALECIVEVILVAGFMDRFPVDVGRHAIVEDLILMT